MGSHIKGVRLVSHSPFVPLVLVYPRSDGEAVAGDGGNTGSRDADGRILEAQGLRGAAGSALGCTDAGTNAPREGDKVQGDRRCRTEGASVVALKFHTVGQERGSRICCIRTIAFRHSFTTH